MNKLLILIVLVGCSSNQILDQLGLKGAKRIGTSDQKKPNFYIQNFNREDGRSIASVTETDESLSNKQIYFLALYQQYHQISSLVDLEQKPAACPSFHNELVTFKDVLVLKNKHLRLHGNYKPVLSDPRLLPSYPVMSLPFDGGDVYTYLVMNPGTPVQAVIKEALYEYAQSLGQELEELCHKGVSDNYFIYENYVAFAPGDELLNNGEKILSAALRIPVFANILLLDSLQEQTFIQQNVMTEAAMARASFGWFKNYLYELEKLRQHRSKLSYWHEHTEKRNAE